MTRGSAAGPAPLLAVIDIGTNSTKLVVARCDGRHVEPVFFARRTTRMGEGLARSKRIRPAALARTADAVRHLARTARRRGASTVVAVGTYAFRSARNGRAAARRIARDAGIDVRILTGREEAALSFASASARLARPRAATVLIDVGGGSTEMVISHAGRVLAARSLPLGALRLTERFLHTDPVDPEEHRRMERALAAAVGRAVAPFRERVARAGFVASGGSATTALDMVHGRIARSARGPGGGRLRLGELRRLQQACLARSIRERKRMPGLPADRADIVPAGIAVVIAFMTALRKRVVSVTGGGVREGVILRLARELAGARTAPERRRTRSTAGRRAAARRPR